MDADRDSDSDFYGRCQQLEYKWSRSNFVLSYLAVLIR